MQIVEPSFGRLQYYIAFRDLPTRFVPTVNSVAITNINVNSSNDR